MTQSQHTIAAAVMAALGLWLMLPPRSGRQWAMGSVLSAVSLGLFAGLVPSLGSGFAAATFWVLAAVTLLGGVGLITSLNPVYSALWFALSLLGTAALFMYQGAQFLGAATIVVYAGAIVVTFLFVLMLAQPDGTAHYDRVGLGRLSTLTSAALGAAIVAVLTATLAGSAGTHTQRAPDGAALAKNVLHAEHVATLGGQLFARHLLAVEIAGLLLLVALVGASVIMLRGRSGEEGRGDG